jgi:hypothetical protein
MRVLHNDIIALQIKVNIRFFLKGFFEKNQTKPTKYKKEAQSIM